MAVPDTLGDDDVAHWPDPMRVSAAARGSHVRVLRRHLADWLGGDHLEADVIDDLVMAASEALENCCDHAYAAAPAGGTMTLTARTFEAGLVVTVADDGRWQAPGTEPSHRGRGLAMMRELVDEVAIEAGPEGTELALTRYVDW